MRSGEIDSVMKKIPTRRSKEPSAAALDRLRRLTRLAPQDLELRLNLACALLDNRLTDEAIEQLRFVIEMSPNQLEARKLMELALQSLLQGPS